MGQIRRLFCSGQGRKDLFPENFLHLTGVIPMHQGKQFPAPFWRCRDSHSLCAGDQILFLHHGKVRQDIVMGNVQEFRQPAGGGEPDPDRILREREGYRSLHDLDTDCRIKKDINRQSSHGDFPVPDWVHRPNIVLLPERAGSGVLSEPLAQRV